MQPHIGRWHCRYRRFGSQPEAASAIARLEHAIRERVSEYYAQALQQVFVDDPAVYVLRNVCVQLTIRPAAPDTDASIARAWGERLCAAATRSIAKNAEDGDLVRFAEEAEYIANFIAELLNDSAWQRWYYCAFRRFRHIGKRETILSVLIENRECLAAIFRYLARLGCLRAVMDVLDGGAAGTLWETALQQGASASDENNLRLFVHTAHELMLMLDLWEGSAPTLAAFLSAYTASAPAMLSWSDRRSLAVSVMNVICFADRRGWLKHERVAALRKLEDKSAQIAARLDWLDTDWLNSAICGWLNASGHDHAEVLPAGVWGGAVSPNQRLLLERLRQVLGAGVVALDDSQPDGAANSLRFYAALAAADPELAANAATPSLIKLLLTCWKELLRCNEPLQALEHIHVDGAGGILSSAAALGPAASDVLLALLASRRSSPSPIVGTAIHSRCAGLYLLVRAVTESRLPQIASAHGLGLAPMLFGMGLMWAGTAATDHDDIDPGLLLWSGLSDSTLPVRQLLESVRPDVCRLVEAEIVALVNHRRALDASFMAVEDVPESWAASLTEAWPADVPVNTSLLHVSIHALRLWARWLPGIANCSVPYLLSNLIRRGGDIHAHARSLEIVLSPAPLDVVLEMSGYLGELPAVSWLHDRSVRLRIDRRRA